MKINVDWSGMFIMLGFWVSINGLLSLVLLTFWNTSVHGLFDAPRAQWYDAFLFIVALKTIQLALTGQLKIGAKGSLKGPKELNIGPEAIEHRSTQASRT